MRHSYVPALVAACTAAAILFLVQASAGRAQPPPTVELIEAAYASGRIDYTTALLSTRYFDLEITPATHRFDPGWSFNIEPRRRRGG